MIRGYILALAVLSGIWSAFFLISLDSVSEFRGEHVWIIWFLPLAGLCIAWMYKRFGENADSGHTHIKDSFRVSGLWVDRRMAPLVFISTLLTHLFGGSAGREGTAVQMSAAFGSLGKDIFSFREEDKRLILLSAVASGFSSVFGTPVAGIFFAFEYLEEGRRSIHHIIVVAAASFIAHFACLLSGAHHTDYHFSFHEAFTVKMIFLLFLTILLSIAVGRGYAFIHNGLSKVMRDLLPNGYVRIAFGGFLIAAVVYLTGSTTYIGLGIPTIESSFTIYMLPWEWMVKLLLTAFTLAIGFRGGDVTPLFFIGATFGSAVAAFFDMPAAMFAAAGFVTVFGSVYRTPMTTIALAVELFFL